MVKEATGELKPAPRERAGSLRGHFGVTLRPLWGHFGVTLGSVSISVGDFGSVDGYFAMIVESLWVHEGPFSKNIHFPNRFLNDFIKLWS